MGLTTALALAVLAHPRHDAVVSVHQTYATLREVCSALTKADGTKFNLRPDQAGRKVAVFCDARPVSELLAALATLYEADWVDTDGVLSLRQLHPLDAKKRATVRSGRLRETLAVLGELGDQLVATKNFFSSEYLPVTNLVPKFLSTDDTAALAQRRQLAGVGWSCNRDLESTCKRLEAGEELWFSTVAGEGNTPRLPPQILKFSSQSSNPEIRGRVSLAPDGTALHYVGYWEMQDGFISPVDLEEPMPLDPPEDGAARGWTSKADLSDHAVEPTKDWDPPRYSCAGLGLAENGEQLNARSGLPVVCDAFRVPVTVARPIEARTVGEYVANLVARSQSNIHLVRVLGAKLVGDWVVLKQAEADQLATREVPEASFHDLEKVVADGQRPTLDDYAAFAGKLTVAQEACWSFKQEPSVLSTFSSGPFLRHIPILKFWNALTADQRKLALGTGLPATALHVAQTGAYRAALVTMLKEAIVPKDVFVRVVMHGQSLPDFGFKCLALTYPGGRYNTDAVLDPQSNRQADPTITRAPGSTETVTFLFGALPDPKAKTAFTLPPGP